MTVDSIYSVSDKSSKLSANLFLVHYHTGPRSPFSESDLGLVYTGHRSVEKTPSKIGGHNDNMVIPRKNYPALISDHWSGSRDGTEDIWRDEKVSPYIGPQR